MAGKNGSPRTRRAAAACTGLWVQRDHKCTGGMIRLQGFGRSLNDFLHIISINRAKISKTTIPYTLSDEHSSYFRV